MGVDDGQGFNASNGVFEFLPHFAPLRCINKALESVESGRPQKPTGLRYPTKKWLDVRGRNLDGFFNTLFILFAEGACARRSVH